MAESEYVCPSCQKGMKLTETCDCLLEKTSWLTTAQLRKTLNKQISNANAQELLAVSRVLKITEYTQITNKAGLYFIERKL